MPGRWIIIAFRSNNDTRVSFATKTYFKVTVEWNNDVVYRNVTKHSPRYFITTFYSMKLLSLRLPEDRLFTVDSPETAIYFILYFCTKYKTPSNIATVSPQREHRCSNWSDLSRYRVTRKR